MPVIRGVGSNGSTYTSDDKSVISGKGIDGESSAEYLDKLYSDIVNNVDGSNTSMTNVASNIFSGTDNTNSRIGNAAAKAKTAVAAGTSNIGGFGGDTKAWDMVPGPGGKGSVNDQVNKQGIIDAYLADLDDLGKRLTNLDTSVIDANAATAIADSIFSGIEPDNDYTEAEIDQVFNLIASGAASSEQVAEYFNLPVDFVDAQIVERNNATTAASDVGASDVTGATTEDSYFSDIVPDGDYTEDERNFILRALYDNTVTSQQAADYFGLTTDQIDAARQAVIDDLPRTGVFPVTAQDSSVTDGTDVSTLGLPDADGDYTQADFDSIVGMINSGAITVAQVAEFYDFSEEDVQDSIDEANRTHHNSSVVDSGTDGSDTDGTGVSTLGLPDADGDYTQDDYEQIVDLFNRGLITAGQIADFYDFSEKSVQDAIDEANSRSNASSTDASSTDASSTDASSTDGSDVDGSTIDGSTIDGSTIDGSTIDGSDIDGSDIDGSDIDGSDLDGSDLDGSDLDGSDLDGSDLDGSDLDGSDLDGSGTDESGTDESGTDESGTDESGTDESGTDESGTDESGTDESGTDESGTDESGTDESGTDESGTDESGTDESGTDESGTDESGTDESGTDESGTDESGTDESGTDESGTDESGTDESGTDESGTDESGTDESGTDESGTDESGTDDSGTDESGTDDSGTDESGTAESDTDGSTVINTPVTSTFGGTMSAFSNLFSNTSTTTESGDPDWKKRALDLWGDETGVSKDLLERLNAGFTDYTGDRFNDRNADQLDADRRIRGNIDDIPGKAIFDKSVAAANATTTTRVDPITGRTVSQQAFGGTGDTNLYDGARRSIQDLVAGQFAGTNLDPYMNPYTDRVINRGLSDLDKATQERLNEADAQATRGGAYGGDRASLERGVIGGESLRTAEKMISDLRYRGYEAAADMLTKDMDREMDASGANQLADASVTRDSMNIAADLERTNQDSAQRSKEIDNQNQFKQAQALLDSFGQGTDAYRSYLGDYVGMGNVIDASDQRDNDFDYKQFMDAYGYDEDMINNMIQLFGQAPRDRTTEESTEMGAAGQLAGLAGAWPGIEDAAGSIWEAGGDFFEWLRNRG